MTKYEFIESQVLDGGAPPLVTMCRWLEVSRSGFYHWRSCPVSATAARWQQLAKLVRKYFKASDGTYGYRRIHADLVLEAKVECSPELVRQIMRDEGLVPCQPHPYRVTTEADAQAAARIPDLVKRDFTATEAGRKFVGDITYIHTWQGFVYLATVIDCYSKKVVGWAVEDHMRADLVEQALLNAAASTVIHPDAIYHSDRGSQGGFNWSSQHPDPGGVQGWRRRTGGRKRATHLRECVGSGAPIAHCALRCGLPADRNRHGLCNASSGV